MLPAPDLAELPYARYRPYEHQIVGVNALLRNPYFMLADEMGAGKTKQVIDAACVLYDQKKVQRLIVIAPFSVRSVWFDHELGEVQKHLWAGLRARVIEFCPKPRMWYSFKGTHKDGDLDIIVTNYDYIGRSRKALQRLLTQTGRGTWLVCDESTAVKNYRAKQTKACGHLRRRVPKITLLTGTPIANNPIDMFSQGNLMSPSILQCKYITLYRSHYAILKPGVEYPHIIGWQNLDELQRRFAPYVLRRLKKDCLDLPEKLPAVTLTVPLSEPTWKLYKQMRDEMVAWLSHETISMATLAITKVMRLAQLCSGILGGIEHADVLDFDDDQKQPAPFQEVSREKLDAFLDWYALRIEQDENFKLLLGFRFRPELERAARALRELYPHTQIGELRGGQSSTDRHFALRLLHPDSAPKGPASLLAMISSGAMGHNMTAAHTVLRMSNDYSLMKRLQFDDRVHRPGQIEAVSYFDIVSTGPQGQKTIDFHILRALREKKNIADWTTSAWIAALRDE